MVKPVHIAPFVLKPSQIYNYTQLIAMLKLKQDKNKAYSYKSINTKFRDVLGANIESFSADDVIAGHLHECLKKKFNVCKQELFAEFDRTLNRKIKEIKRENDQHTYSMHIRNIKDVEAAFFMQPSRYTFKDNLLYDLYVYLSSRQEPLDFLRSSYINYIKSFVDSNSTDVGMSIGFEDDAAFLSAVTEFTKLRFNREEFAIEAYEGRYLWAEVFVLLRTGRTDLIKRLFSEYEIFFEFVAQKFRTLFVDYLNGKTVSVPCHVGASDDRFKKFLFSLIDGRPKSDGSVICTVEDYLWMKLLCKGGAKDEVVKDFSGMDNSKTLFMANLLMKKYKSAVDILLKSDFNLVAKFFLLRELCLEQALDAPQMPGFRGRAALAHQPLLKNVARAEDSSSTCSLDSVRSSKDSTCGEVILSGVNPIFMNFMFSIVSQMSSNEHKVKFIEMLKSYGDYHRVVPHYIIKYDLFSIIGKCNGTDTTLDYYLDAEVASGVVDALKDSHSKKKLVQLHKIIPDQTMIGLLNDVVEDAILTDESVDTAIIEDYISKLDMKAAQKLRNLYGLYSFLHRPEISTLRRTALFEANQSVSQYKFVIEKVLPKAIEVIRAAGDREMAKCVFKLCGVLSLNEECCSKAAHDLALLI